MSHFGVLSYKGTGHLNPLISLSRQLVVRGHRVTFFHDAELEARIRPYGLGFSPIAAISDSIGENTWANRRQKPSSAIPILLYRVRRTINDMERFLRGAPQILAHAEVDALIVDELSFAGPTIAEILHLPYFVISTSVPHDFGWSAPSRIASRKSIFTRIQNALLEISVFRMKGPVRRRLDNFRRQVGLRPIRQIKQTFPELAHITQLPQCMDFPRSGLPATFHYTGPFVDEAARISMKFSWDQLDGRPIIYASFGTTLKGDPVIFRLIAEACDGLGMQLVIALGGRRAPEMFHGMPGKPLIVKDAPQLEILKRAEIVVTHAGANTVLETLMQGKPMIAIPKEFDQPAIAARLEWLGVAIVLQSTKLSAQEIRSALATILSDPSYRSAARGIQAKICAAHGLERAAELIEQSMERYREGFKRSSKAEPITWRETT